MNSIKMLVVALCVFFFSLSAPAATVNVIAAESVGRNEIYWAGVVVLDVDGQRMLGMFDTIATPDRWMLPLTAWEANLYTRTDILAGAPVNFSPERYSNAAPSLRAMEGAKRRGE